jgi:ethanolamine utilization cobalamin adenosyltransferase
MKENELLTSLNHRENVPKDHEEIVFRGKLDSLYALTVYVEALSVSAGEELAAKDIACIGACCLDLIGAGVRNCDVGPCSIMGMDAETLRDMSHHVESYGMKHFLPVASDGELLCAVNLIRTGVREVECMAVSLYGEKRMGIITMLNRMSSAAYIIMCRIRSSFYSQGQ